MREKMNEKMLEQISKACAPENKKEESVEKDKKEWIMLVI